MSVPSAVMKQRPVLLPGRRSRRSSQLVSAPVALSYTSAYLHAIDMCGAAYLDHSKAARRAVIAAAAALEMLICASHSIDLD